MASTPQAQRSPMEWDWSEREQLRAERGFSLLLTVTCDARRESVLYDCGLSHDGVAHNLDVLGLAMGDVRTVVLSHDHADHHSELEGLFVRGGGSGVACRWCCTPTPGTSAVCHPYERRGLLAAAQPQ